MKYIKTIDGRVFYARKKTKKSVKLANDNLHWEAIPKGCYDYFTLDYEDDEILKQANTIEELGDTYVIVPKDKKFKPYTTNTLSVFDDFEEVLKYNDIYMSIWVGALLKPAAKMNDEGVLCLI